MNNIYCPSFTQTNEISYKTINYPSIKKKSFASSENKLNIEEKQETPCQKLLCQLSGYRTMKNNKKNFILDEDDIKNNENFKLFMNNLLNKEDSTEAFLNSNIVNNNINNYSTNNTNIHSNKDFFNNKKTEISFKIYNNKNKKEEDLLYTFYHNKLRNKTCIKIRNDAFPLHFDIKKYIDSMPKKINQQVMHDTDKNNNNDLDIDKNKVDEKNSLLAFPKEKISVGINCKIIKKRNSKLQFKNKIKDSISQLSSTFSLKEFDGRMLNNSKLNQTFGNIPKKKNKNNSFNQIKKNIPEFKIPKIIFFSRNRDIKQTEHKLNTMKENVLHFLKDKSYDSLTGKKIINNLYEKNDFNNSKYNTTGKISKNVLNPKAIIKYFLRNEFYLMPYIKNFEKSYNKKIQKRNLDIRNKKIFYSSFKNKDYYNMNNNLKNVTITNIK